MKSYASVVLGFPISLDYVSVMKNTFVSSSDFLGWVFLPINSEISGK
jgi:hypothetical protein